MSDNLKIDRRLNIVIPVETETGTFYVHSTPLSQVAFEQYFLIISKTFAELYKQGLSVVAGPRIAKLLLKQIAMDMGQWDGPNGIENGLINEMRRLTSVVVLTPEGWRTVPFQDVISKGAIGPDDLMEVEGAITFFMVVSSMHKKNTIAGILTGITDLWGVQTTLLNVTEYANSLPISTATDNSGAKETLSSMPS